MPTEIRSTVYVPDSDGECDAGDASFTQSHAFINEPHTVRAHVGVHLWDIRTMPMASGKRPC